MKTVEQLAIEALLECPCSHVIDSETITLTVNDKHEGNALKQLCNSVERKLHEYAAQFKPVWVSVKERLPEIGENVLVMTEFLRNGKPATEIFVAYRNESGECVQMPDDDSYGWDFEECVTHWMPMPEPPKTESK